VLAGVVGSQIVAGNDPCWRADSLPQSSEVRRLWEGAVATLATRDALLDNYTYMMAATIRDSSSDGVEVSDTAGFHYAHTPPYDDSVDAPLAEYRGRSLFHWSSELWIDAPTDDLYTHREFFRRFSFDDRLIDAGDGAVQIRFVQRARKKNEIEVGDDEFQKGSTGRWEYLLRGKMVGKPKRPSSPSRSTAPHFRWRTAIRGNTSIRERRPQSGSPAWICITRDSDESSTDPAKKGVHVSQ
jgi:hypothetical protein